MSQQRRKLTLWIYNRDLCWGQLTTTHSLPTKYSVRTDCTLFCLSTNRNHKSSRRTLTVRVVAPAVCRAVYKCLQITNTVPTHTVITFFLVMAAFLGFGRNIDVDLVFIVWLFTHSLGTAVWTDNEKSLFGAALQTYGKDFSLIQTMVLYSPTEIPFEFLVVKWNNCTIPCTYSPVGAVSKTVFGQPIGVCVCVAGKNEDGCPMCWILLPE